MLKRLPIALTFLPIVASAAAAQAPSRPPPPDFDMVAFEMKSWGEPVVSWQFSPYGGIWTETKREEQAQLGHYTLVVHDIEPDVSRFIELEQLLRNLPDPAPVNDQCENFMTDQPYGTIRLTRGATTTEIAWNAGCMDDGYAALLDPLKAANELAKEWGQNGNVVRTEEVGATDGK